MLKAGYRELILIIILLTLMVPKTADAHCLIYIAHDDIDDITINLNEKTSSSKHSFIDIKAMGFWVDKDLRFVNLSMEILGTPDVAEDREYTIHISGSEWSNSEKILETTTFLMKVVGYDMKFWISNSFDASQTDSSTKSIEGEFSMVCSAKFLKLYIDNIPEEYDLGVFDEDNHNSLHISAETNYYDEETHYQDVLTYDRQVKFTQNDEEAPVSNFNFLISSALIVSIILIKRKRK